MSPPARIPESSNEAPNPHTVGTPADALVRTGVLVAVLVALLALLLATDAFERMDAWRPWLLVLPVLGLGVALYLWYARHR